MADDPFLPARLSLERGDYGQVLRTLADLAPAHPPATAQGAQLQLLMATAWMGQGNTAQAMACCRQVKRCSDPGLRAQARDLLTVLEAPALERPRRWSITLPALGEAEPLAGGMQQLARRRRRAQRPAPPPPPPVGPTRPPLGFAALVLALLLLAMLLGGCGTLRSELHFHGPGRLQVGQRLGHDAAGVPTPWERQFGSALRQAGLKPAAADPGPTGERLLAPVMPAAEALELLAANVAEAARLAGMAMPRPRLEWHERNWLVGVQQRLVVEVDLSQADPLPGAGLSLDLEPLRPAAVRRASPEAAVVLSAVRGVRWPLRCGAVNALEVRCWRWSPLGLGAGAILLGLSVVLLLGRLRQQLGFGLPGLPA
ncbi:MULTISPECIES: DUF3153 domain-containing protein [Aphanothece]|uniref:DUF3153 domain-containing protein n=1 Tax=Aphanothece TaxID=1121 RepID=UPI00398520C2